MELIRGLYNLKPRHHGCVATIGAFDGVHLGHQALLAQLRARGCELGLPTTVISFEPTPREYFLGAQAPARLNRFREKFVGLAQANVDRFLCVRFDQRFRGMSAQAFAHDVLVDGLGARWVVVGHDFHFARGREGEIGMLRNLGAEFGFGVDTVAPVLVNGERASSTLIRAALAEGDLDRAGEFLGAPYHITGRVVRGQRLGRTLGFPTVNLRPRRRVLPLMGIFAVRVTGAGLREAPAVASLGTRPTVDGTEPLLEAYIFDYAGDLYGKHLRIDFIARLRDELKFPSLDELVIQMREDEAQAKRILKHS